MPTPILGAEIKEVSEEFLYVKMDVQDPGG